MTAAAVLFAVASLGLGAQEVEKLTPVPAPLLKCLEAGNCKNTIQTRLNWFDQINIPISVRTAMRTGLCSGSS